MADHFGLDFDLVEFLARVDTDDAANHLGHNDHVSEMRLDQVGLLVGLCLLLRLAQLLDQTHRAALEASVESTTGAGMEDGQEFVGWDVQQSANHQTSIFVSFFEPNADEVFIAATKRTGRDRHLCMKTFGMFFSS